MVETRIIKNSNNYKKNSSYCVRITQLAQDPHNGMLEKNSNDNFHCEYIGLTFNCKSTQNKPFHKVPIIE